MCKKSLTLIFKNLSLYFLRLNLFLIELYISWIFSCYSFYNHIYANNNEFNELKTFFEHETACYLQLYSKSGIC